MFWTGSLFRLYFSCCEIFNAVQKAGFCEFIVGSEKFFKLFYLIRFWYLSSHSLFVYFLITFSDAWVSSLFWKSSGPTCLNVSREARFRAFLLARAKGTLERLQPAAFGLKGWAQEHWARSSTTPLESDNTQHSCEIQTMYPSRFNEYLYSDVGYQRGKVTVPATFVSPLRFPAAVTLSSYLNIHIGPALWHSG